MKAVAPLLADISDTARWVAHLRALESDRRNALFRDPFARRLAGERGRDIAEAMPDAPGAHPGASGFAAILAVRTKVFDELILDSVKRKGVDAVLNLAAGLDARPYRLPLPPRVGYASGSLAWWSTASSSRTAEGIGRSPLTVHPGESAVRPEGLPPVTKAEPLERFGRTSAP